MHQIGKHGEAFIDTFKLRAWQWHPCILPRGAPETGTRITQTEPHVRMMATGVHNSANLAKPAHDAVRPVSSYGSYKAHAAQGTQPEARQPTSHSNSR